MKMFKLIVIVLSMASAVGCSGEDKTDVGKSDVVKDGWRRLDPKHYAAIDDISLLKRWVEIDYTGTIKKDVESKGGVEAMLAKVGGKIDEKGRKCIANLLFLNDALVGMGVSHTVVTAVLDKASHTYNLKRKMSIDDVAVTLPGVVELYGVLANMKASPADVADYLVGEYIDSHVEKRGKVIERVNKKAEKYRIVKDVLVSAGVSPNDADAGLALFVFKHGSGLERTKFWDNEKTFAKIDCKNVKALVPDCRKLRKILSTIKETKDKNMAEPLIDFMATPADERADALLQIETYVKTFVKNRKEYGDFAAALQAREVAEKAVKNRDKTARTTHDRVENKKTSNVVRRDNAKAPGYNQVHGVVVEFVREIVTEAEDAKIIFTDGSLDEEIREECKRRRVALEPCSMMDMEFSREAFMEKMTNGVAVAQLGFHLFKRDGIQLSYPGISGCLYRHGRMSDSVRLRGIEFAGKLAERILDLQKRNVLDSLEDEKTKRKFLSVQWRIARMARLRAEQERKLGLVEQTEHSLEIADKLDECNPVVRQIQQTAANVGAALTAKERLQLALRRANFEEAQKPANEILKANPDDSEANFAMGMWHVQHERLSEAEKYLIRCRDGKPRDPAIWNNLAVIYLKTGKLAEAKRHVREALRLCPDLPEVKKTFEAIEKAMAK